MGEAVGFKAPAKFLCVPGLWTWQEPRSRMNPSVVSCARPTLPFLFVLDTDALAENAYKPNVAAVAGRGVSAES